MPEKKERCPDCGEPVETIFDHIDIDCLGTGAPDLCVPTPPEPANDRFAVDVGDFVIDLPDGTPRPPLDAMAALCGLERGPDETDEALRARLVAHVSDPGAGLTRTQKLERLGRFFRGEDNAR